MDEAVKELLVLFFDKFSGASISKFDDETQEHLSRNDEIMALVDSARLEIQHTTDVAFANLLSQTKELQSLFSVIDAVEAAVDRAHDSVKSAWDRVEVLKGSLSGSTGKPTSGGLALVANLFTRGASSGGSSRSSPDTPIRLPPYTPLLLDLDSELAALSKAVGGKVEVAAARKNYEALILQTREGEKPVGSVLTPSAEEDEKLGT